MRIYCELRGEDESALPEVLELLGLSRYAEKHLLALSQGTRRKVELAKLMLAEKARVLIADELAGLDAITRSKVLEFIRHKAKDECTLVVTLWTSRSFRAGWR